MSSERPTPEDFVDSLRKIGTALKATGEAVKNADIYGTGIVKRNEDGTYEAMDMMGVLVIDLRDTSDDEAAKRKQLADILDNAAEESVNFSRGYAFVSPVILREAAAQLRRIP